MGIPPPFLCCGKIQSAGEPAAIRSGAGLPLIQTVFLLVGHHDGLDRLIVAVGEVGVFLTLGDSW